MADNLKIMFNGREVELPFNINDIFSQIQKMEQRQPPQEERPQHLPEERPQHLPIAPQRQIIRKITMCKDTAVRNVVIDMNKRLTKLEELLKEKTKSTKETKGTKETKSTKTNITKTISKAKETPKTKGKSKEKAKVTKKKIGKKK